MKKNNDKDWKGNSQAVSVNLGVKSNEWHTRERHNEDYYATEPKAVKLLLENIELPSNKIWECACGGGHLSEEMSRLGYDVYSSDLIDRGYGNKFDFLSIENQQTDMNIITNPPYIYANEFIVKAMEIMNTGNVLALFLPIRYLEGKARKRIFKDYPPKLVLVSSGRLICARSGNFKEQKGSAVSYMWIIWQKDYTGKTFLEWFN